MSLQAPCSGSPVPLGTHSALILQLSWDGHGCCCFGEFLEKSPELYRDLVTSSGMRKDCRGEFIHIKTRETALIWVLEVFQGYHMPLD